MTVQFYERGGEKHLAFDLQNPPIAILELSLACDHLQFRLNDNFFNSKISQLEPFKKDSKVSFEYLQLRAIQHCVNEAKNCNTIEKVNTFFNKYKNLFINAALNNHVVAFVHFVNKEKQQVTIEHINNAILSAKKVHGSKKSFQRRLTFS